MAGLFHLLDICLVIMFYVGVTHGDCTDESCDYPCNYKILHEIRSPHNCFDKLICVAPYEFSVMDACAGSKYLSNDTSCACVEEGPCEPGTCIPQPDPIQSEPCLESLLPCTEGDKIPDKYYCSKYFQCDAAADWISFDCSNGYFFNRESGNCEYSTSSCTKTDFDGCLILNTTLTEVVTTPDITITATEISPVPPTCPVDKCIYSNPPFPCSPAHFQPDPFECQNYRICVAPYEFVLRACPGIEEYNYLTCQCGTQLTTEQCYRTGDCDPPVGSPPQIPDPEPCLPGPLPCNNDAVTRDKHRCYTYFLCVAETWELQNCPQGMYFDGNLCQEDYMQCSHISSPTTCFVQLSVKSQDK